MAANHTREIQIKPGPQMRAGSDFPAIPVLGSSSSTRIAAPCVAGVAGSSLFSPSTPTQGNPMRKFLSLFCCGLVAVAVLATGCTSTAQYKRTTDLNAALDGDGKPIFNEVIKPVQIGDQIAYQTTRTVATNASEYVKAHSKSLVTDKEIAGFKATTTDVDGTKRDISIAGASSKPNAAAIAAAGGALSQVVDSAGNVIGLIVNPAGNVIPNAQPVIGPQPQPPAQP